MTFPELKGFSGASLEVCQSHGKIIVRKTAFSEAQGTRLKKQAAKQRAFLAEGFSIGAPVILNEGVKDGAYYFEMEFIRGTTGQLFLERCTFAQLQKFADQLTGFLVSANSRPPLAACPYRSWFDASIHKLLDVQKNTNKIPPSLLGHLYQGMESLRQLSDFAPGFCHGDLTLENIIVDSEQKLWAIDFLDSPFEHPWQDFIKLDQDILGEWYKLKGRRISPASMVYLQDRLSLTIREVSPSFFQFRHILLALNFCRIIPYARSEQELQFLFSRIEYFSQISL